MKLTDKSKSRRALEIWMAILVLCLLGLGCEDNSSARQTSLPQEFNLVKAQPDAGTDAEDGAKEEKTADAKKVEVGKNVWLLLDGDKRKVMVQAEVCLREGMLEHLMCRQRTKE